MLKLYSRFAILVALVGSLISSANSQDFEVLQPDAKLFAIVELGYAQGVGRADIRDKRDLSIDNNNSLYRGRVIAGVLLHNKTSLGLGVGIEKLHNPDFNTFPVTIDYRYYWKDGESTFLNISSGYSVKLTDSFYAGIYSALNVGYRIGDKHPVLLSMGLDFHQIKNAKANYHDQKDGLVYIESSVWLYGFSFQIGVPLQRGLESKPLQKTRPSRTPRWR